MTTKFQVGQECKINAVEFITVSRRTEVSVWFIQNGKEFRRKIQISGYGENSQEFVNFQGLSLYAIKTPQTINEPQGTFKVNLNETPDEPQDTSTEPKVKSLIICGHETISDVVYSELINSFNLKDDECLTGWGGFYRYEKPKKSMTESNVYFVLYEHVNGRSGGNYQVKVTFEEPCTTVETTPETVSESPNETPNEPQTTLNEPQDVYCVYEVSTIEGLETDLTPEYCVYEVTSDSPEGAIEIVKYRLTLQNTRFKILGVCEA